MQVINVVDARVKEDQTVVLENVQKRAQEVSCSESKTIPVLKCGEMLMDNLSDKEDHVLIEQGSLAFLKHSRTTCFLGIEAHITYSTFKGFAQLVGKKDENGRSGAGLIRVDAHAGLKPATGVLAHDSYLRRLIDDGIVDPQRIILIAVRSWSKQEVDMAQECKIKVFSMKQIAEEVWAETCFSVMESVRQWQAAYLSINLSGLDPAFASSVRNPEPGGLSSRELLHLIHKLKLLKNIGCYDLVGFNSGMNQGDMTLRLGAKILAELA